MDWNGANQPVARLVIIGYPLLNGPCPGRRGPALTIGQAIRLVKPAGGLEAQPRQGALVDGRRVSGKLLQAHHLHQSTSFAHHDHGLQRTNTDIEAVGSDLPSASCNVARCAPEQLASRRGKTYSMKVAPHHGTT
jgi:hypothetical protein